MALAAPIQAFNSVDPGLPSPTPEPTPSGPQDLIPAHFDQFSRVFPPQCGGDPEGEASNCFVNPEGVAFRYACREGEPSIYTDVCGMGSCDECSGNFELRGEMVGKCYDDGQTNYRFLCGEHGVIDPLTTSEPTPAPYVDKTKTCEELQWGVEGGDLSVCGQSALVDGECAELSAFDDAAAMCYEMGARLCTADELIGDETKGTGCKGDCGNVWSSTECQTGDGEEGHFMTAGAKKCADKLGRTCSVSSETAIVRCCAEVGTPAAEEHVLPEGYSMAFAHDYKLTDGVCGKESPVATYSCWTNPTDQKTIRFACKDDTSFIHYQYCGKSTSCEPENCFGEFKQTPELKDQCYKDDGYMYEYKCS